MSISLLLLAVLVMAVFAVGLAAMAGGRSSMMAVLGVLAVACLGGVAWFVMRSPVPGPVTVPSPTATASAPNAPPAAEPATGSGGASDGASPVERRAVAGRVVLGESARDGGAKAAESSPFDAFEAATEADVSVSVNVSVGSSGASTRVTSSEDEPVIPTDASGPAAEGALVEVFPADVDVLAPGEPLLTTVTDAEGRFRAEGVPGTNVRLRARREPHRSTFVTHAPGGPDATLVLHAVGTVTGVVRDKSAKVPVKGARVVAAGAAGALTDAEGRYRIEGAPRTRNSRTRVKATAPGYVPKTASAKFDGEGAAKLDFALEQATTLSGRVLGIDGNPVAGATVVMEATRDVPFAGAIHTPAGTVTSGEGGRYAFEYAPVGKKLRLRATTERAMSENLEEPPLSTGSPREGVDIRLEPAAAIVVTVVDANSSPVAGVAVSAEPKKEEGDDAGGIRARIAAMAARAGSTGSATTDEKGVARIGPMRPGLIDVSAQKDDFRPGKATVTALPDRDNDTRIVLDAGQAVAGRVVDDAGAPVEGASVTAQRMGGGMEGWLHEMRQTDAEGRYRIGGLDAKPVTLSAQKEGFVRTSRNDIAPGTTDADLTLTRGGVITGIVKDPEGKAVTKFRVKAERTDEKKSKNPMDMGALGEMFGGPQTEDAGGKFRVDGLEAGTYEVVVKTDGLAPGRVADVVVAVAEETAVEVTCPEGLTLRGVVVSKSDGRPLQGASVSIREGGMFASMDIDFDLGENSGLGDDETRAASEMMSAFSGGAGGVTTGADGSFALKGLEEGKVSVRVAMKEFAAQTVKNVAVPAPTDMRVELAEGGVVTGRVTDMAGQPLKGHMVMLQKPPFTMRMTSTAEDGTYRVGGLATGTYLFYVMENPGGMFGGGPGMNLKTESLRVEEGKTVTKDYRKGDGVKLTGRVTRAGKPVESTMVMVMPGSGKSASPMSAMFGGGGGGGFAMGTTDAEGKYEITGLNPGRYTVSVTSGMGGATASEPLEIPAGSTSATKDLVVPVCMVKGIVVTESGEPVAGAQVMCVKPGTDLTKFSDLGEIMDAMGGQGFTDDEGRFTVDDLAPGTYTLRASSRGHGTVQVESVTASASPPEVRVVLQGNHPVNVKVVAADGSPVQGASVYLVGGGGTDLSQMDGFDLVRTDSEGRVEIHAPAGSVTVEAVASGHGPGTAAASVPSSADVVVRLPAPAVLEVVATVGGSGASGGVVELLDAEGNPYRQRFSFDSLGDLLTGMQTDGTGRFVKRDLPAGTYRVRVTLGEKSGEATTTVGAGETKRVEIAVK